MTASPSASAHAALAALEDAGLEVGGRAVLNGVSLSVQAGECVVLCGPNGAGKSSVIRALAGLLPLTKGRAILGGSETRSLSARERAGRRAYLPQERRIAWNLPAVEVAALGAPLLSGVEALIRAHDALREADASHLADRGVAEMSGGERARVLLARVLAAQAPLLLVDEPVAGLDPEAQLMVLERLKVRAAMGQGLLVSLHDLGLAARYADRVIVLDRGRLVADGPAREALCDEVIRTVFNLSGRWIDGPDGPLLSLRRR